MPIEIRELVIRATVDPGEAGGRWLRRPRRPATRVVRRDAGARRGRRRADLRPGGAAHPRRQAGAVTCCSTRPSSRRLTLRAFKPAASPKEPPQPSDAPEDTYTVQVNPSSYSLSHLLDYSYQSRPGLLGERGGLQRQPAHQPAVRVPVRRHRCGAQAVGARRHSAGRGDRVGAVAGRAVRRHGRDQEVQHARLRLRRRDPPAAPAAAGLGKPGLPLRADARSTTASRCSSRTARRCARSRNARSASRFPTPSSERRDNDSSPDLTHLRDVRDGDTLPLLAYDIYGNAQLYLEVARVNKLVNFRRLRSASRLSFPPLDKQAATS